MSLSKNTFVYDGKIKKPSVRVTVGGRVLSKSEYTATYSKGRINPGEYKEIYQ